MPLLLLRPGRATGSRAIADERRRLVASLVSVLLIAAACGTTAESAAPGSSAAAASGSAAPDAVDAQQLDCVRDAYPCSWDAADPVAIQRTDQLLAMSSLLLSEDATTDEIASRLEAAPGIEAVAHDKITVWFRVAGAPPVFVFADPTEGGILEGALPPIDGDPRGPSRTTEAGDLPESRFTGCPMQGDPLSDGKGGTAGTAGKPQRALILGPWQWQMGWDTALLVALLRSGDGRYRDPGVINQIMTRQDRPSAFLDTSGEAVRIEDFCGWQNYNTIILKTHGRAICEEAQCYTALSVGRFAETKEQLILYAGGATGLSFQTSSFGNLIQGLTKQQKLDCIRLLENPGQEDAVGPTAVQLCLEKLPDAGELVVTTDFFRANYAGGLKDRMIFLSACQGMKSGDLAPALRGSGTSSGVILGFDRIIQTSIANEVVELFADKVAKGIPIDAQVIAEMNTLVDKLGGEADVTGKIEGDFTAEELADLVPLGSESTRGSDIVSLHTAPGGPELEAGGKVKIQGRPGDQVPDIVKVTAGIQGVREEGPEAYEIRLLLDGEPTSLDDYVWVDGDSDDSFFAELEARALKDLAPGEPITLEIQAVLPNTQGEVSLWRYPDLVIGNEGGATITVGGQTWDFVLADGPFGCMVSEDGTELLANGWVEGTSDPSFGAILRPTGVGTSQRLLLDNVAAIQVRDGASGQIWMADPTDTGGFNAAIEAIPGGASQIDSLTIEGSHAFGTATFIERNAVFDAWSNNTPLPASVPGSFDIECVQ